MNKFRVGDILEGTDQRHRLWNCEFTVEVAEINDNECRVRFLSWISSDPHNQLKDRDDTLFWYPSSFFKYAKSYSYASRLFIGD